jgi:hypothetical protein
MEPPQWIEAAGLVDGVGRKADGGGLRPTQGSAWMD